MIGARDIEAGSLIVSVDQTGLTSLIEAFRLGGSVDFALSPAAPRPVFSPVTHLAIQASSEGPLLFKIEGEDAVATGGQRAYELLADELTEFQLKNDLGEPGMHAHFDPNERQSNGLEISGNSVELIVTGPVPDD
jgi:hypothetical protein